MVHSIVWCVRVCVCMVEGAVAVCTVGCSGGHMYVPVCVECVCDVAYVQGVGGGAYWFLKFLQLSVHLAAISFLQDIKDGVQVIHHCPTNHSKTKQLKTVNTYYLSLGVQKPMSSLVTLGFS